ncbi:hypothetical protein [Rhodococcus sp. ACT016]|uniref:hypothetical protein n=1 Tax=Rhodococcus sp. ACT016 TaxID=3134808 RepID=UPI003D2A1F0D
MVIAVGGVDPPVEDGNFTGVVLLLAVDDRVLLGVPGGWLPAVAVLWQLDDGDDLEQQGEGLADSVAPLEFA